VRTLFDVKVRALRAGSNGRNKNMPLIGWIAAVAASVLVGAGVGWWVVNRIMARQFKARLHRATELLKQQHAATDDKLRAAHTRATLELEQLRAGVPRQVAVATAEARAKISRLEEQLRHAHAELDKLRPKLKAPAARPRDVDMTDGFAATRPFGETL
jgi:ABC-type nickel/cobalt efflux system permease component RcnA